MDADIYELIQQIHAMPRKAALATTGGGATAAAWLLAVPGGSRTVLEAAVPYANAALIEYLGRDPGAYCSASTARAMALRTRERAAHLAPGEEVVGVGCTASLRSDRPKRGDHRIHVAAATDAKTVVQSLTLAKEQRDREGEESVVSRLILNALAEAFTAPGRLLLPLLPGEVVTREEQSAGLLAHFLAGETAAVCVEPAGRMRQDGPRPAVLLPGSFNPLHEGHRRMAFVAAQLLGKPAAFELSAANVEKPLLGEGELRRRMAQFAWLAPLWLTRSADVRRESPPVSGGGLRGGRGYGGAHRRTALLRPQRRCHARRPGRGPPAGRALSGGGTIGRGALRGTGTGADARRASRSVHGRLVRGLPDGRIVHRAAGSEGVTALVPLRRIAILPRRAVSLLFWRGNTSTRMVRTNPREGTHDGREAQAAVARLAGIRAGGADQRWLSARRGRRRRARERPPPATPITTGCSSAISAPTSPTASPRCAPRCWSCISPSWKKRPTPARPTSARTRPTATPSASTSTSFPVPFRSRARSRASAFASATPATTPSAPAFSIRSAGIWWRVRRRCRALRPRPPRRRSARPCCRRAPFPSRKLRPAAGPHRRQSWSLIPLPGAEVRGPSSPPSHDSFHSRPLTHPLNECALVAEKALDGLHCIRTHTP